MWEEHFDSLLPLVKEYVVNIWEARKITLYGDDSSQSQSSAGDLGDLLGLRGRVVRICVSLTLVSFTNLILVWMYVVPPMRMGAWLMARVLRQRIEYYYCYKKRPKKK